MRTKEAVGLVGLAGLALSYFAVGCSGGGAGGGSASLASAAPPASTVTSPATTTAPATSATSAPPAAPPTAVAGSKLEYLEFDPEDSMSASDIVSLLSQTVGAATLSSGTPASALPIRNGFLVTATPQGSNTILEIDSNAGGVRPLQAYVQVAVSSDVGQEFVDLVQVAMATEALSSLTPGLAEPWNLYLHAESATGGVLEINVAGDASANFTISWKLVSPQRPINSFATPSAFGPAPDASAIEKIGGTVHFPIDEPTFKVEVNRAYGYNAPQRFSDFPLTPHTWLHLTVTADSTGQVVNVHFDAITTSGARLAVAEAPASTDVGGRFFDETVARMEEMAAEEAAQPGSSKTWGTSFYYADPAKGVVDVVVKGVKGETDIAYAVESPVFAVSP